MANIDQEDDDNSSLPDANASERPNIPAQLMKGTPLEGSDNTQSPINDSIKTYLMGKQQQLADAQDKANTNQLYAGLARAGGTFANAVAGNQKPIDETGFNALDQAANAPVQEVMNQQKSDKAALDEEKQTRDIASDDASHDPDSDASKEFRSTFKAQFPAMAAAYGDDFDNLTSADSANVFKVAETKARIEEQAGASKDRNELMRTKIQTAHEKQQTDLDTKDAQNLDNYLGKTWSARSGAAGATQAKINAAEAAEALIQQGRSQKGGLDSRQIEELAQSASRMLGGGAAASARVEALVPHTFWGKVQSAKEWASNSPTGADQQEFVDRIGETVSREKALAQKQKMQYQVEGLPAHQRLQQNNPTMYDRILSARGVDTNQVGDNGRLKDAAPSAPAAPLVSSDAIAAEKARRQAIKQQPQGLAYGGMVGGLPASNFAAEQAAKVPKQAPMHLPSVHKFASGGVVPGHAQINHDDPRNDVVPAKLSRGEAVLPLHVMQAKDPAMAAYLFVKHLTGKS